jgi:anti-anti-sigma factor
MDVTVVENPAPQPALVTLRGQLDIETAPRMRAAFDELMRREINRVVVDLSGLTFCDSIGLSTFILVHRCCTDAGGYLRLAEPTPFLARVITGVRLSRLVPVYDSVATACSDPWTAPPGGR